MAKIIYFVRHGESEGNVGELQQGPKTPLTPNGHKQAERIGQRLAKLNFDKLVSSSNTRAVQTAEYIKKATGKDFIESDLLVERIRPSEQLGKNKDHNLESQELYLKAWLAGEKYKDGESFDDIVGRVKKALDFLESFDEECIVVVTHGIFLRALCAVIILGDLITPAICNRFMWLLKTENTGITVIKKTDKDWNLITWNDHAHFAE